VKVKKLYKTSLIQKLLQEETMNLFIAKKKLKLFNAQLDMDTLLLFQKMDNSLCGDSMFMANSVLVTRKPVGLRLV